MVFVDSAVKKKNYFIYGWHNLLRPSRHNKQLPFDLMCVLKQSSGCRIGLLASFNHMALPQRVCACTRVCVCVCVCVCVFVCVCVCVFVCVI